MPKTRESQRWDDAKLSAYSQHLYYEMSMFCWCGVLLSDRAAQPFISPLMRNLIVEGFCVHLRGLLEFFCRADGNHTDDVLAVDFMSANQWGIPALSNVAKDAWNRVNKEVGHLTARRREQSDPNKTWGKIIPVVLPEVMGICREFVRVADPQKVAKEVRDFVP